MMMIIARHRKPIKIRSGFKNLKKILKAKKASIISHNDLPVHLLGINIH